MFSYNAWEINEVSYLTKHWVQLPTSYSVSCLEKDDILLK